MSDKEFIAGIISGDYNENDVKRYCYAEPSLMPLFKSLYEAASTLILSKGVNGGFIWNLTKKRFGFDNSKDLRLYMDAEFTRLQDAMGIVCDLIESENDTESKKPQHGKEIAIKRYIVGGDKETVIKAIRGLVCGKIGKQAALPIFAAVANGYMSKTTFDILKAAFGIEGTKQAFNSYYSKLNGKDAKTYQKEIDAALAALKRAIEDAR